MSNPYWQYENNKKQKPIDKTTTTYAHSLAYEGYNYAKRNGVKWRGIRVLFFGRNKIYYKTGNSNRVHGISKSRLQYLLDTGEMIYLKTNT